MSEQLSLGDLAVSLAEANKSLKSKRFAIKTDAELAIDARINALIDQKNKSDALVVQAIPSTSFTSSTSSTSSIQLPAAEEPEILTVSHLNKAIKGLLEKSFSFLWVKGEISNFKTPGSGHMYFTLKDAGAQVKAVMFRGFAQGLKFRPEDGMEVLVRCKVTVYEPRGDYQLFCEVMEPVGFGALQIAFEKLKSKLQAEGLFEQARKKLIPAFPSRIGIITSPTGAAIRDMLNVLGRRLGGGLDITIFPVNVQGDKASGEIAKALDLANRMGLSRFDVLIVGRGGGSLEDLWAFNMEEVARAVSRSLIPTISAVGHEVDFTICDFVADLRAPTPSAAAELVVKNKADLVDRVNSFQRQIIQQTHKKIKLARAQSEGASKRLIHPKRKLQDLMLRTDEWSDRLTHSMQRYLSDSQFQVTLLRERLGTPQKKLHLAYQNLQNNDTRLRLVIGNCLEFKKTKFSGIVSLLNGLSPLGILDRGYSIVKKGDEIIKDAAYLQTGDVIRVQFHQGTVDSKVL